MGPLINSFQKNRVVYLLFLLVLLSRAVLYSPWLEDWDSVQYVMGMSNYSLADHTPHPPGYPMYIFTGKLISLIVGDGAVALTLISIASGSALFISYFYLAQKIMSRSSAYLSSLLLVSFPVVWLLSEVALTNIVGLFLTLLVAILLHKHSESKFYFYVGSFLGGIVLGYRFAEYSIIGSLILLTMIKRRSLVDATKASIYFFTGVFIWLIPVIYDTGLMQFVNLYKEQSAYIRSHDSIFASDITLSSRISDISWLLEIGYTKWIYAFMLLMIFYLIRNWKRVFSSYDYIFISVWILSYSVPLLFLYNLEVPRHVLPIAVPLVLLLGKIADESKIVKTILLLAIVPIFIVGVRDVYSQHIIMPPTISPVTYVSENYDSNNTAVVSTFTYRQFEYYAPEFSNYYGGNVPTTFTQDTVILEHNGGLNIDSLGNYELVGEREFTESRDLFPRVPKTKIFIYKTQPW